MQTSSSSRKAQSYVSRSHIVAHEEFGTGIKYLILQENGGREGVPANIIMAPPATIPPARLLAG
jgi:hypothetical protein